MDVSQVCVINSHCKITFVTIIQIYLFVDLPWCESIGVFSFPFSENIQKSMMTVVVALTITEAMIAVIARFTYRFLLLRQARLYSVTL